MLDNKLSSQFFIIGNLHYNELIVSTVTDSVSDGLAAPNYPPLITEGLQNCYEYDYVAS